MKRNQPKLPQPKSKSKSNTVWLVLAAIVLFGGIAWFSLQTTTETTAPATTTETTAPATRVQEPAPLKLTTLPPSMFIGAAREAYQTAMDIPEVLQQLQCYCGCKQSSGHENNLWCFTDGHGAG